MIAKLNALVCRLLLVIASGVVALGLAGLAVRYTHLALLVLGAMAWRRLRRSGGSDAHGSARVATPSELERHGWLEDTGLILGRTFPDAPSKRVALASLLWPRVRAAAACRLFLAAFISPNFYAGRILRVRGAVHVATFAPTGAGKGVSVLIPNLLAHPGSSVVTDPKGELFAKTAEHRRKRFGHKIIRLDPFGVCGPGSDTLNPFDFIDPTKDDFLDCCRDFANMIVVRQGTETDPHWNDSAELNLTAFTAFVCGCEPDPSLRNLTTVRAIASARGRYSTAVAVMQKMTTHCQGVIGRLGGMLTWFTGDELSSVLSTFQRHTAFLDSPAIARNTASSSFDPMILRTGRVTVYLILPPDKLASLSALQRMWIGCIMRRITRNSADESRTVHWFLDEAAHLGRLAAIEDAATLLRGAGIRLWFFFQSLEQLKVCFGEKATTILDNIGTQQFFGINAYPTAEEISRRIGDATITSRSINDGQSNSRPVGGRNKDGPPPGSSGTNSSVTTSEIARRLLKPEEVLVLPEDTTLIFHKNMSVIPARLLRYYDAPEFARGRCGRQAGLGLAAGVMAVFVLSISVVFSSVAAHLAALPPSPPIRRPAPYHGIRRGPGHRSVPARHSQRRTFGYGMANDGTPLIKID